MRHGNKINALGRKRAHRKALLKNLSNALIIHKRINTTLAKAKVLREHIEPIITKCKVDTTNNRRIAFSHLQDKESIKELFGIISEKVMDRPGGYTRIIKTGFRQGDAAEMAMIELVDFNEVYNPNEKSDTQKTRRSRRKKTSTTKADASESVVEEVVETVEEVVEQVQEKLEDAKELVEETVEEVVEQVQDKVEDVKEVVEEKVEKIINTVEDSPEDSNNEDTDK